MGILARQARNIVASAVVASVVPDSLEQVKEAVGDMLGENMKAAAGLTSIAASIVISAVRDKGEDE